MTVDEISELFDSIGIIPINIDVSGTNPIISFEICPYKEFISERNHKLEKVFESVFTGSIRKPSREPRLLNKVKVGDECVL